MVRGDRGILRCMDPFAALLEIAELLERERASRYKSRAFRTAAAALAHLPVQQRSDLAIVRRTKGIGESTYAVIAQATGGAVPDYLLDLRASLTPVAQSQLRSALRGDLHCHSDWSDGQTSIETMVDAAVALGHEYLALTDHSPRLRVARGLSPDRLRAQLDVVATVDRPGFTLLSGIEVDILADGNLDQEDELLARLDVVVASAHSALRMDAAPMTQRLIAAVRHPRTDVLGHVTGRLVGGARGTRPPSTFDARAVFAACAETQVAVEINSRPEREDPPDDLIQVALAAGCLFSIDSDAHAPGQLALVSEGAARAERAGIPAERIVTTWPLERLREWTRRPRG